MAALNLEDAILLEKEALDLGMDVLVETHTHEEIKMANKLKSQLVGVNNRNLKTFEVDLKHSRELSNYIPKAFVKVSESGIGNVAAIKGLKPHGFEGFLIGESFMKTDNPGASAKNFIQSLKT